MDRPSPSGLKTSRISPLAFSGRFRAGGFCFSCGLSDPGKRGCPGTERTRCLRINVGAIWIILALIGPYFRFFLAVLVFYFVSGNWFDLRAFIINNDLYRAGSLFLWLLPLLSYGIFEEIGWRGFALPRLQKKYNALLATFILTVFWGFWHLPMFFYRFSFSPALLVGFFVSMFVGAILFTFVFNSTRGSVFVVMLWHIGVNIVSVLDMVNIAAIMSVLIMAIVLYIVVRYGYQKLSVGEKFVI